MNYPGETSWISSRYYRNYYCYFTCNIHQTNVPTVTQVCVPDSTVIEFELLDSFGDGLCGSCYGGQDGSVLC